ncbi:MULTISPECIES: CotO family spore coat protein [Clostridia]|uniref:CotO family spore coat protein n=1 Tax=Clostridia TaxID=186801 RepID=UPI000EA2F430|nr:MULTISPECIES: CotO family spore coat protein [Clostridia]NBJ70913.1 hypothetical protein [Roseburia sp. 1XD42-34]RKI75556.1 hypothetical protein D7V87_15830 [Clostridium sp. 1xD42-85]
MGKKYAKKPLLFIHQPNERDLHAPMQHMYVTPKKEQRVKSTTDGGKKKAMRHPSFNKNFTNQEEEVEKETKESEQAGEKPKFKDLSIEEKVDYFIKSPSYAPKLKCEIKTEQRTYRGIITGAEENDVFIRVGNRSSSIKVSLDDIKHIKLLGF